MSTLPEIGIIQAGKRKRHANTNQAHVYAAIVPQRRGLDFRRADYDRDRLWGDADGIGIDNLRS